jgi:hypothetical protein
MSHCRRGCLTVLVLLALVSRAAADQGGPGPACLMKPAHAAIAVPAAGRFVDADDDKKGACGSVPTEWQRARLGNGELTVNAKGPEGSGRYWAITIGLSPHTGSPPSRGVCLETSTAGYRSLRSFGGRGLPWLTDLDGDRHAEAVIWSSFFLTRRGVQSETGLNPWVYRVDASAGTLTVDLALSRQLAREVARAYRIPLSEEEAASAPTLREERRIAAEALEAFADGRCTVPQEPRR